MVRLAAFVFIIFFGTSLCLGGETVIQLPAPKYRGDVSLEEVLKKRRSLRSFAKGPLSSEHTGQLLWAAQGITDPAGLRTAPSAGALYPLETYLVVREVDGLEKGVYKYLPKPHALKRIDTKEKDPSYELYNAALMQDWVRAAQINIVFGAVFERTTSKYRERGIRYVYMEAGHAAQNVLLQAEALSLGGVVIGAFYDDRVKKAVGMEEEPIYIISVGRR